MKKDGKERLQYRGRIITSRGGCPNPQERISIQARPLNDLLQLLFDSVIAADIAPSNL